MADAVFMHALLGILMHALDGASMLLFNAIFTHTIIITSMDILHVKLWQTPRNHIAAPQGPPWQTAFTCYMVLSYIY